MELLLISPEEITDIEDYNWDISVTDGIADSVPEGAEADQEAAVVTYLQTNSIPLLEDKGVDWTGFLLKRKSLSEIDTKIRENISTYVESVSYAPVYVAKEGKLAVQMTKLILNTGA